MLASNRALATTPLQERLGIITEDELAALLTNKVETLRVWRSEGIGPKWVKLGKSVFYRLDDVVEWINSNIVKPGAA